DKTLFSPARRDRVWLRERYGIPADRPVLLFAGRVDQSKRVLTTAETARRLLDEGHDLHLLVAGEGSETGTITDMLGERATLTGNLAQTDLATLMASGDLFVFPSESEIVGNVVIEAKASGLPVIVTGGATTAQLITSPGFDGILSRNRSVEAYVNATRRLLADPARRRRIGNNARICIEETWPDWTDVLAEDLLSVWQKVWKAHH
ncbi:MAG: glycosyltransferase, partial [Geminicoccaceae bacterium]